MTNLRNKQVNGAILSCLNTCGEFTLVKTQTLPLSTSVGLAPNRYNAINKMVRIGK